MVTSPGVLLAHQGGWDEALVFAVPILVYVGIRIWERRRGEAQTPEEVVEALPREQTDQPEPPPSR